MRSRRLLLVSVVLGVLVLSGKSVLAETWPADAPQVSEKVRQLMQDRNYTEAIKAIDSAVAEKDAPRDYLTYLKGRAYFLMNEQDKAVAVFDAMQKDFPKSDWLRRARFAKAASLARKGDFQAAELIVRVEADYLLSTDRKQQVADIYLEFADSLYKPAKEDQKPDFAKALEFYKKALEVGPKPEKKVEVELLVAQCKQQLNQAAEAAALYEKFVKDYPQSKLDIEARFRLGECRLAEGNMKQARRVWQDLLAKYVDDRSERMADAQYQLARTWKIPAPENDEDLNLGAAALKAFIEKYPKHKLASVAHLEIAQSYLSRGRHEEAVAALKQFLVNPAYQDRAEIPEARNLLGRCYQSQKKFAEAIAAWQEYLAKHPAHQAWSDVQREIVNTEYLMAIEKQVAKKFDEANKLFGEFLTKYPLDARGPRILLMMNAKFIAEKKWTEAMANWRRVVSKYPGTEEAAVAQFAIASTLETELGKPEEALEEYRKVTWGQSAAPAQAAIARLTTATMTVSTERVFRSNETPKLKLTTRNVETVTVRAYKVDMETYFRKMHLASGVEGLDIALIDPDKTFEYKVPKYAKHQQFQSEIEVPLPADAKSGVMAVTVSSKTLEATTLVIQSDLDVIVKSSRDEVFVFAENMLTGKPWTDARLLISNGKQVFAEGVTGKDGVFQKSFKELKEAGDIRVFAVAGGNAASNVVDLQGVGFAQGLSDKGFIYTDRPAYRAGQVVHIRGCLRRASGDVYTVEKGKKFTLDILDSRSRLLRQETVTLGEFGSFHTYFALPVACPQGQYRVSVHDDAGQNYQGGFLVQEYRLEPIRLAVDTPRSVYYRGEEIEGVIRATYYYGAPLAGRTIRYQLADERLVTAVTDEKGEVHFKLPTREFNETQWLAFKAELPERNLQQSKNFLLSLQAFSINVRTVRPVYVAGEKFEVAIKTLDAEAKPIGQKLSLKVYEQTTVDGKVGEHFIGSVGPFETDPKDGTAKINTDLDKGGNYVLRVEGIDRFKNPITGQASVQISGNEDKVRLRILADTHSYKVGDTAAIKVHWRELPALALVTFQGARVLDYRLVELKSGVNELSIPMDEKLAPNFDFSIAVMTDQKPIAEAISSPTNEKAKTPPVRFHEASSPINVERDLRVKFAVERKATGGKAKPVSPADPLRPGDEVEVIVTTTDPQGKPVSAEVSLAMVEQSLLDRFGGRTAAIRDYFAGQPRQSELRTTSSITFAYMPETHAINPRLLAEEDRLEVSAAEDASRAAATAATSSYALGVPQLGGFVAGDGSINAYAPGSTGLASETSAFDDRRTRQPAMGRETQSLMMSVTPRVIIQEEEEEKLGEANDPFGGSELTDSQQTNGVGRVAGRSSGKRSGGYFGIGSGGTDWGGCQGRFATFSTASVNSAVQVENGGTVLLDGLRRASVLDDKGTMQTWQFGFQRSMSPEERAKWATTQNARLAQLRAVALMTSAETAYWNPAIVTDKDGRATVSFTLPEESTAWELLAKGITTGTQTGEATESIQVKKNLFGQLKLPQSFIEGDEAEVLASIHNDAIDKGQIEVVLKTIIGGRTVEQKKTIDVKAKGIQDVAFKLKLEADKSTDESAKPEAKETQKAASVAFELTVAAAAQKDVAMQTVPLLPYGAPVFATAAGAATSDTTTWVETPKNMPMERPALTILVGPTVEQSLMDALFAPPTMCQMETSRIASGLETATSDLMAAVGLQKLLGKTREAAGPQAQELDARLRSAVSLLVCWQNDDGGWSWTGSGGASERFASSRVLWALSLARKAGYKVHDDNFNKAVAYVQKQMGATADNDYESKAVLLHALSMVDKADFAMANRLYRERMRLSSGALVHLALAFAEMDRKPTASELLESLAKHDLDAVPLRRSSEQGSLPGNQSPAELRALAALALEKVSPQSAKAKEMVDWLMAHRDGHRWSPEKATGPATLALCQWFAESRFEGEKYTLKVFVNDVQAKVLEVDPAAGTQTIEVPEKLLTKEGRQRINFQIAGRGRYVYQCILGGFVPAEKLKNTTDAWTVTRDYEPAPMEVDGREIPRGFGIVQGQHKEFSNPLTQMPVGRRGLVDLKVNRRNISTNTPREQLEYLVLTEPIPSGATVIEKSVSGDFERFEIMPGAIVFYVGNRCNWHDNGKIHYELYGYLPGSFRAGPTLLRNAHRPEQLAVSTPKSVAVLPLGAKSADPYRLTPRELFELGKQAFDKGDMKAANGHLAELAKDWNLNPEHYKRTTQMLLDISLELGPASEAVRCFEIVKEKWPDEEIPFAKIVKVGAAYHEMGEYERSYLIFRATIESSFLRETGVAGFLLAQGQFTRSVDVLGKLLREYPPEGYVASATYAQAQQVFAKAPEAAVDPELRKQKINRVDLVRRAWTMLESFLTAYPDDPAADQASFAAATALLEMQSFKEAAAACDRYAKRYPKSELLDAYWYVIGFSRFSSGEHKEALEMCGKVADSKRVNPATGVEEESRNKWQAIYILGQIHHSLGEAADAIREYRRVEDKFIDAKQSIDYFLRKAIELPEVVTVKPGEPVDVELKFRNVAACDLKVYRIDLMKFSLLKRNLSGITQINLAGIRPQHEEAVKLGDGKDYRDRTHKLTLPLKDEGAYLVVCRGDDMHASGLVLVSPLTVEVQEEGEQGRIRATVKDRKADKYLHDVHVKVIGQGNEDFVSGQTDLRGVFVADGIAGAATVIAQAGPGRYAFYRAKGTVMPMEVLAATPMPRPRVRSSTPLPRVSTAQATGIPMVEVTESEKKIYQVLDSQIQFDFNEAPLSEVVNTLKGQLNIEIQIDNKALTDMGIGTDTPVTKNFKDVSFRTAIQMMLRDLNLTYMIRDGLLLITTPEEADNYLTTKMYPVADLVLPLNSTSETPADFVTLIDLVTSTIKPTSWDEVGGPGSIAPLDVNLTIVVSQTQDVHQEIEDLLVQLRKIDRSTLPAHARQIRARGEGQGMGGGMGGMMGGGMGGGAPQQPGQPAPTVKASSPAAKPQQADLLQGVRELNTSNQGKQSQSLQKMYNSGKGGVGAGGAF